MDQRITGFGILLIFLVMSCSQNSEGETFFDSDIHYSEVTIQHVMTFEEISQPRKMRVISGRLVVSDFSNAPAFHLLNLEKDGDLTYLEGRGTEGNGLGEYLLIEDFIDADSLFYIFDGQQQKLTGYLPDHTLKPVDEVQLKTGGHPLGIYSLNDGTFAAAGLFPDARIEIYGNNGEIINRYGDLVSFDENFSGRDLAISWYSFSAVPPEKDAIYLFSSNSDYIEKYSTENGELLQTVMGNENPYPRMELEMVEGQTWPVDNGSIYSYLWADADHEYLYGLYSGEMQANLERFQAGIIHIFDHELNFVAAFELDHYPFTMAADQQGGIYTVTHTDNGAVFRHLTFRMPRENQ